MRIHDLLVKRQQGLFVGRSGEFALLQRLVAEPDAQWQLLHFHGPGGIGKSTLLRLFAEHIGPDRCITLDGNAGICTHQALLVRIQQELSRLGAWPDAAAAHLEPEEVTRWLNAYAEQQGVILLSFDAFEKWGFIESWLREEWLPSLSPKVRICTAGRFPLKGEWQGNGWNLLVRNQELPPLSLEDVAAYGRACGITDTAAVETLKRISGGHPLALALASEVIARHGRLDFERLHQHEVIQRLMAEMLEDIGDSSLHLYLEAATVVRRFDQELLQVILDQPIPADGFRALCALPFITGQEQHWMLHDSVRTWALADLKVRKPGAWERYRTRAFAALRTRREKHPEQRAEWLFDQLYLSGDEFLHGLWFQEAEHHEERCLSEADGDRVEWLYRTFMERVIGTRPGDQHLAGLLRPLLRLVPEAFRGLWDGDRLLAFCAVIPLTEESIRLLQQNPIAAPIAERYEPGQLQYYIGLAGHDPDLCEGLDGVFARLLLRALPRRGLVFNQILFRKWEPYLRLMGFERIPWADGRSAAGEQYHGYALDLRTEEQTAKIERLVAAQVASPPAAEGPVPTVTEVSSSLRRALRRFDRLHLHPKLVQPLCHLVGGEGADSADALVGRLQQRILQVVDRLAVGTEAERVDGEILRHAFLQKEGSHERAAERLNMSVPTYYRHLRLAVHRLAQEMVRFPGP